MMRQELVVRQSKIDFNNCGPALVASIVNADRGEKKFGINDIRSFDDTQSWWSISDIKRSLVDHRVQFKMGSFANAKIGENHILLIRQWWFFRHWVLVNIVDDEYCEVLNPYYGIRKQRISSVARQVVFNTSVMVNV